MDTNQSVHDPDDLGSDVEMATRPSRRRTKKARVVAATDVAKKRGKRRSLSKLTDMPLDVIYEILSHLLPGDLLHMARSTKIFRALLMQRSSATIWRAARGNVPGLPECPDEMSEPAYANLVFTTNCHYCGKPGIQAIEWMLLARCCKNCREDPTMFFDATTHADRHGGDWLRFYMPTIVRGKNIYIRMTDVMPILEQMEFVEKEVFRVLMQGHADRMALFKAKVAPYRDWYDERSRNRGLERDEIRSQRRTAIWEKLAELGLGEERELMSSVELSRMEEMEGMKEATPLTDRNWDKVKEKLTEYVRDARRRRINNERSVPYDKVINAFTPHLNEYARTRPLGEVLPGVVEFCLSPRIRNLIFDVVDEGLDILDIDYFKELIPQVCDEWRSNISNQLYELLPPWLQDDDTEPATVLQSALVWFHCSHKAAYGTELCRHTSIAFPRIMGHMHIKEPVLSIPHPENEDDDLVNSLHKKWILRHEVCSQALFDKYVTFDLHASLAACEIVALCGLDPVTATSSDMDELDMRIACVPCEQVMTWRKAVSHIYQACHKGPRTWVLLNDQDQKALLKIEVKDRPKPTTGRFYCCRCREFEKPVWSLGHKGTKALKAHLEQRHDIALFRPKIGIDYYFEEGEPNSDSERPLPVKYKDIDFKVTTAALVKEAW